MARAGTLLPDAATAKHGSFMRQLVNELDSSPYDTRKIPFWTEQHAQRKRVAQALSVTAPAGLVKIGFCKRRGCPKSLRVDRLSRCDCVELRDYGYGKVGGPHGQAPVSVIERRIPVY